MSRIPTGESVRFQVRLLGAVLATGIACERGDDQTPLGDGDTEGDDDVPPRPVFVQPATGMLELTTNRAEDLFLAVSGITFGTTELSIDGRSVGSLITLDATGKLDPLELQLLVHGALVPGLHTLQLVTPTRTELLGSQVVSLRIVPPGNDSAPLLTLSEEVVTTGAHVISQGLGSAGLLVVERDATPRAVELYPAMGSGWNVSERIETTVPGHEGDAQHGLAAAAFDGGDEDSRIDVAWVVGRPGSRIDVRTISRNGDEIVIGAPRPAVVVDQALTKSTEFAFVARPMIVGDSLIAELFATSDIEAPRPGDRGLVTARLVGDPIVAKRVFPVGIADVDGCSPALDLVGARFDRGSMLAVRMSSQWGATLRVDASDGTVSLAPTSFAQPGPRLPADTARTWSVLGAFGSRTVVATTKDGRLLIRRIDDSGSAGVTDLSPEGLPARAPVDQVSLGILDGAPFVLVPYGKAHVVHMVSFSRDRANVFPLDGFYCDEIAVPGTIQANVDDEIAVACLMGGQLRFGRLAQPR